ncbi:hypothetical protein NC651_036317 [Populus alba x Populus x berolinensis]|nr:hypothetical protein NC651_036317 [Populus alba x Populus x berolinensis]
MWRYVSGTYMVPKNTEEGDITSIDAWEENDAMIITWINNSIEHFISTQLKKSLGSIDSKESAKLKTCGAYIECREQQRLVQFLTALRSDFKGLRVAVPSKQFFNHHHKPYIRVGFDECSFYKQKGQLPHSSLGMSHSKWVLDSSASHHMSPDSSSFTSVFPSPSIHVMTINDTPMPLAGVGSVVTPHLSLFNVYLISNLKLNLVSEEARCLGLYLQTRSSDLRPQDGMNEEKIANLHRLSSRRKLCPNRFEA